MTKVMRIAKHLQMAFEVNNENLIPNTHFPIQDLTSSQPVWQRLAILRSELESVRTEAGERGLVFAFAFNPDFYDVGSSTANEYDKGVVNFLKLVHVGDDACLIMYSVPMLIDPKLPPNTGCAVLINPLQQEEEIDIDNYEEDLQENGVPQYVTPRL